LVQCILTWGRRASTPVLRMHIQNEQQIERQLENLCEEEHGVCALLIAEDVIMVHGQSLQYEAKRAANGWYAAHGSRASQRGNECLVIVSTHEGQRRPSSPYEGLPRKPRAPAYSNFTSDFEAALGKCLSAKLSSAVPATRASRSSS
jgi:hypothetical protein